MMLSSLYFMAEVFGFLLGLTIVLASQHYKHRDPQPLLQARTVDVLVPTYKEPIELIRRTLLAAKAIDHPHQTFVLDDGKRIQVRALAEELGIHYLSRPHNSFAKAGNLNFGLAHSKAEFVAVFDADHIALPRALDMTLGFFADEKVAFVQAPQCYYNNNAFQYLLSANDPHWHDQSFFFDRGLACADAHNAASCVGTGVVYRRSAIDAIGGIPTTTVTEDIHTAIKLHKAGFTSVYLNEPIAYGEAAPDLAEYVKTRHRWGYGNIHALVHENVLFCKGLTLRQRLHYLIHGLIHLEGWQQLALIVIPVMTLVFGLQPFEISVFNIAVVMTFPLLSYGLLRMVGDGYTRYWAGEILAMARWPVHLRATLGLFGKPILWLSSRKGFKAKVLWRMMLPQLLVMAVSLSALAFAVMRLNSDFRTGPLFDAFYSLITTGHLPVGMDVFAAIGQGYTADLVIVAGFWSLYNAVRVLFFVQKVVRTARQSDIFFRFPARLAITHAHIAGQTTRLSEATIECQLERLGEEWKEGDVLPLTLALPDEKLAANIRIHRMQRHEKSPAVTLEGSFIWQETSEKRDKLANFLYTMQWQQLLPKNHASQNYNLVQRKEADSICLSQSVA